MKMGTPIILLCMFLATVSAAAYNRVRRDHTIDYFNGNCSAARHQQLQEWIPEGCPSIKDTYFLAVPPDGYCNARCSQYLYESLNECYGIEAAFDFEQECSVNAKGAQCYLVALHFESLDIEAQCDFYVNDTYCSPSCIDHTMAINETHGCCLFVTLWLSIETFNYSEQERVVKNDLSTCNVTADFCPPSFSQSVIGVPPNEETQNTVNIGLITGLTILAVVLVTLPILIFLLLWLRIRKQKHSKWKATNSTSKSPENHMKVGQPTVLGNGIWNIARRRVARSDRSWQSESICELKTKIPQNKLYSTEHIELLSTVGQGESGLVYKAYVKKGGQTDIFAIKTGKAIFTKADTRTLMKEVKAMLSFNHPNVMSLIGLCLDTGVPLIIMPFMANGSVLEYLKSNRGDFHFKSNKGLWANDGEENETKVKCARNVLLGICYQIAKGMSYLAERRFVHRDLAARNCMMDHRGIIKVGDFGLTEDMYDSNYYRRGESEASNERVPIRWMAPESIEEDVYNEKTDVWSFGVTCWEVFTCGRVPFSGISAMSLLTALRNGERLERPINAPCSDEIYHTFFKCWDIDSKCRPHFTDLVQQLSHILEEGSSYLDLNSASTGNSEVKLLHTNEWNT